MRESCRKSNAPSSSDIALRVSLHRRLYVDDFHSRRGWSDADADFCVGLTNVSVPEMQAECEQTRRRVEFNGLMLISDDVAVIRTIAVFGVMLNIGRVTPDAGPAWER